MLHKIDNPTEIDNPDLIKHWFEPICSANIITPIDYIKPVKSLIHDRRGYIEREEYINEGRVVSMQLDIPLSELVLDFFDRLKSCS